MKMPKKGQEGQPHWDKDGKGAAETCARKAGREGNQLCGLGKADATASRGRGGGGC